MKLEREGGEGNRAHLESQTSDGEAKEGTQNLKGVGDGDVIAGIRTGFRV